MASSSGRAEGHIYQAGVAASHPIAMISPRDRAIRPYGYGIQTAILSIPMKRHRLS